MLAALACGGHVLLEDVPGTAKTVLARAIAQIDRGRGLARIQCTPDLQPTDVDRPLGLQPADARVRVPAGADLRERRARRRDQPRDAEDAVGAARGDGRAAGDGRRRHAPAPDPFLADRDREPDRAGGHVPAARGAARPLLPEDGARLPGRGRGAPDHARAAARAPARRPAAGRVDAAEVSTSCSAAVEDVYVDELLERWIVDLVRATRDGRGRRDRRLGARQPRARADRARVGAAARARLRRPRGRRARCSCPCSGTGSLLTPSFLAETRALGRDEALGADPGPLPRARAAARARLGRRTPAATRGRRRARVPRSRAVPARPALAPGRAPVRRAAERAARARLRRRRLAPVRARRSRRDDRLVRSRATLGGARRRRVRRPRAHAEEAPRVVVVCDRRPAMALYAARLPWLSKPARVSGGRRRDRRERARRARRGRLPRLRGPSARRAVLAARRAARRAAGTSRSALADGTRSTRPRTTSSARFALLARLRRDLPAGSFVFVVSDFLAPPPPQTLAARAARALGRRSRGRPGPGRGSRASRTLRSVAVPFADREPARVDAACAVAARGARAASRNEERLARLLGRARGLGLEPVVSGRATRSRSTARSSSGRSSGGRDEARRRLPACPWRTQPRTRCTSAGCRYRVGTPPVS